MGKGYVVRRLMQNLRQQIAGYCPLPRLSRAAEGADALSSREAP
jgi:hypothetical protein